MAADDKRHMEGSASSIMNVWFRYTVGCLAKIHLAVDYDERRISRYSTWHSGYWMLQVLPRHYLPSVVEWKYRYPITNRLACTEQRVL